MARSKARAHVSSSPATAGAATDFTPGDFDSPPYGAATGVDYAFLTRLGCEIAYLLKNPDKIEAISTNSDIIVCVDRR